MHLVAKCNAMNVELRRHKIFEECRLKYSKVLGEEWGDESKRKAEHRTRKLRSIKTQPQAVESRQQSVKSPRHHKPQSPRSPRKESRSNSIEPEKPLPCLPVPTLQQTLERYLNVLKPITTDEQHKKARDIVERFISSEGEGPGLQAQLKKRAEETDNWAYSYWLDDMYLKARIPLPIHSNPGMVFPRNIFDHHHEQIKFAARLVSGILDYKVIIDARGLPIDRANTREKGQPLCMEQYYRLFSSYRLPGVGRDELITTEIEGDESEHIIVLRNNQMFILPVVHGFTRLTEDDICCQLRRICQVADNSTDESGGIGILTSLPRNLWAATRELLQSNETNKQNLRMIETSIFVLCLDKAVEESTSHETEGTEPKTEGTESKTNGVSVKRTDPSLALQMLHGQGSNINSCNRWYDSTMQFIVGEDGACGLNYEHSPSEGIAVVQLVEHVLRYMEELRSRKLVRMNSIVDLEPPIGMKWKVDDAIIIQHTDMARYRMDKALMDVSFEYLRFDKFGRDFPKSHNMSPDCFIQLSLQLTYFRCHGCLVSTYESASIRRFRLGRVDNIRAASSDALTWVRSMSDTNSSMQERMKLLRAAIDSQTDYMVNTILGYGIDNHLMTLKTIAGENAHKLPEIFTDETWDICNNFVLSTSQVNTSLDSFMGYGPVVPNGYGASYNPQKDQIIFCITSFISCKTTDSQKFSRVLTQSLLDMKDICEATRADSMMPSIKEGFSIAEL